MREGWSLGAVELTVGDNWENGENDTDELRQTASAFGFSI